MRNNLATQIRVLNDQDMANVHEQALNLLEKKGIVFRSKKAVETFKAHGAKADGDTVYIPRTLVMKALSQCPSSLTLEGLDPSKNVTIGTGENGVMIHPAGGEVFVRDYDGTRRPATLKDFENYQKLCQSLENINIAGYQPISPSDIPKRMLGVECLRASFKNCNKPILSPMELETIEEKVECLQMFNVLYGQEDYVKNHYVTWHIATPNSPLVYSEFACEGIRVFAEYNQPIALVSAPMNGITAPIYLLSTVILDVVETLAGLTYAQLVHPGIPVVCSSTVTSGNMHYASWECASPESALMLAACIQMYKVYYKLPTRTQTGCTSSKTIDFQAGMETMQSFLFTTLAGADVTSNSVGSLENLMTTSFEKMVLDDELIGRAKWITRGMDTSEEQMGIEELMECEPMQDFLCEDSTIEHMYDGYQPTLSDWSNYTS